MLQMEGDYFPMNKLLKTVPSDLFVQGQCSMCVSVGVWVCPGPLLLVCKVHGDVRYSMKFWNKLQCFIEQTAESS